jgi:hypothetical protein
VSIIKISDTLIAKEGNCVVRRELDRYTVKPADTNPYRHSLSTFCGSMAEDELEGVLIGWAAVYFVAWFGKMQPFY